MWDPDGPCDPGSWSHEQGWDTLSRGHTLCLFLLFALVLCVCQEALTSVLPPCFPCFRASLSPPSPSMSSFSLFHVQFLSASPLHSLLLLEDFLPTAPSSCCLQPPCFWPTHLPGCYGFCWEKAGPNLMGTGLIFFCLSSVWLGHDLRHLGLLQRCRCSSGRKHTWR